MSSVHRPTLPKNAKQVLFVCTGNSCRSVMAEAIFKKMAAERNLPIQTQSCGTSTFAGIGASPETVRVLKAEGVEVAHHRGQKISPKLLDESDIILVMQKNHRDYILENFPDADHKVYLLTEFYTGEDKRNFVFGIPDPIGMSTEFYRNVLAVINNSLRGLIEGLEAAR